MTPNDEEKILKGWVVIAAIFLAIAILLFGFFTALKIFFFVFLIIFVVGFLFIQ